MIATYTDEVTASRDERVAMTQNEVLASCRDQTEDLVGALNSLGHVLSTIRRSLQSE